MWVNCNTGPRGTRQGKFKPLSLHFAGSSIKKMVPPPNVALLKRLRHVGRQARRLTIARHKALPPTLRVRAVVYAIEPFEDVLRIPGNDPVSGIGDQVR